MNLTSGSRLIRLLLITGFIGALLATYCLSAAMEGGFSSSVSGYARISLVLMVAEALIFLLVFAMYAARKVVPRVKRLAAALQLGAQGDLTVRVAVDADDEIGNLCDNFNIMLEKLSEIVKGVNGSISELRQISTSNHEIATHIVVAAENQSSAVQSTSAAVQEIGGSVVDLSAGIDTLSRSAAHSSSAMGQMSASIETVGLNVEKQAQASEDVSSSIMKLAAAVKQIDDSVGSLMESANSTASAVAEMDMSIKQVEKNAMTTATLTDSVKSEAETGKAAVEATIQGIGQIRRSTRSTFTAIANLSERAGAINRILSVIDELAEQTNLLALNSAIIAAQAGEHGKGFAVVADQIKELAKRTRNSTQEIAGLISGVQSETDHAFEAIKQAEKMVAEGEKLSEDSGAALKKIVSVVETAISRVSEIARATGEQARGSQQIKSATEQVADMVQNIASSTREQGKTGESIKGAVVRMKELTSQVRSSTGEQRKVWGTIAEATAQMEKVVDQLEKARNDQSKSSDRILGAVMEMEQSTVANLGSARVMDEEVERLVRQIDLLTEGMAKLKVLN